MTAPALEANDAVAAAAASFLTTSNNPVPVTFPKILVTASLAAPILPPARACPAASRFAPEVAIPMAAPMSTSPYPCEYVVFNASGGKYNATV